MFGPLSLNLTLTSFENHSVENTDQPVNDGRKEIYTSEALYDRDDI